MVIIISFIRIKVNVLGELLTSRHEEGNSESAIQHTGPQTLQCTAIEWQSPTH